MRMRQLKFATLLLAFTASLARADPVVHAPTGIAFPDTLAGYARVRVYDYERESPGYGLSYGYNSPDGVAATVYVYTRGLEKIPSDVAHAVFDEERVRVVREITLSARRRGDMTQQTLRETAKLKGAQGEIAVLVDAFSVAGPGGGRATSAWLWGARGHFVMIRMTRRGGNSSEIRDLEPFVEAVARLAE